MKIRQGRKDHFVRNYDAPIYQNVPGVVITEDEKRRFYIIYIGLSLMDQMKYFPVHESVKDTVRRYFFPYYEFNTLTEEEVEKHIENEVTHGFGWVTDEELDNEIETDGKLHMVWTTARWYLRKELIKNRRGKKFEYSIKRRK